MPRKQFVRDFTDAQTNPSIPHIHDLCQAEDDGQISFLYAHAALESPVKINALIPDLCDYPDSHTYMVYADDDTPAHIARAISERLASPSRLSVQALLQLVSTTLTNLLSFDAIDLDSDLELEDAEEEDDIYDDEPYYTPGPTFNGKPKASSSSRLGNNNLSAAQNIIRSDLRAARDAGFRIGLFGEVLQGIPAMVTLSCRIRKLGISDEAINAWQLRAEDYLILAIRYPLGYHGLSELQAMDASRVSSYAHFRIGTGPRYKPDYASLIRSFQPRKDGGDHAGIDHAESQATSTFRDTFISRPLCDLINSRLLSLLTLRLYGMSWSGAETFYDAHDGCIAGDFGVLDGTYFQPDAWNKYPDLVTADHFSLTGKPSFPLLATQYLLRRFVRCTDFCLVCHQRLPEDLEALKPYICERPLCLYQYMTLGFGPEIEHEIIAQPLVVDLLISFCYKAASEKSLKSFPNGLEITIPRVYTGLAGLPGQIHRPRGVGLKADVDLTTGVLQFPALESPSTACPLKVGQWIACVPKKVKPPQLFHCRVTETQYYPTVKVSMPVYVEAVQADEEKTTAPRALQATVSIHKYDQLFDSIPDGEKHDAIRSLLDTLPAVQEMKSHLLNTGGDLKGWKDRISPSALSVLRWIIASNRACIFHLDPDDEGQSDKELVYGMQGWTQFRFAMGAPDKERRFTKAVRETTQRLNLKYPSLFAWHGSHIKNWHSIIREGLRYDTIVNGRAFGDGCYHSLSQAVSLGYCHIGAHFSSPQWSSWANSSLKPRYAMSLNEIVNAPKEFQSCTPHLVIQQLDWIQTRYLFVSDDEFPRTPVATTSAKKVATKEVQKPKVALAQDPEYTPVGVSNAQIMIPAKSTAEKKTLPSKRKLPTAKERASKKGVKGRGTKHEPLELDDSESMEDDASQATDEEDHMLLMAEVAMIDLTSDAAGSPVDSMEADTGSKDMFAGCRFTPGNLDHSSLPIMPQPSYASTSTTKRLQRDFLGLLKVQKRTPGKELGWFIDPDKFDNVYQWIVELHSFDIFEYNGSELPLAKDMKKADIESVVLEMRFGASYPMSPPFVRVIRPRFLGFQMGGGGHVTAGGAMCMELLTNDGWTAATGLEAVLLQVRLAIASTDPQPARLETVKKHNNDSDYGSAEAVQAYKRACLMHGWTIPSDFDHIAKAKAV